ncbi:MAG TPA: tRNA uridine-5-carboxymethylaminomethyl(34) synthesis GTPase MnmE [Ignavibacteria bacterium]|nr:tRNA uridine-5-carboxymethylaminomethyl(34) synthesis GTPase MnmE [Ignavibacteria bacterium]
MTDTIAAISTPMGEGGISVIRISGENVFKIIEKIFSKDRSGKKEFNISNESSHTIHFGYIFDVDYLIDEGLISIFKNPNSYTGEDVVEISSHGGSFISQKILSVILKNGARHAEPGEFTKRAFLNGKLDLSQAEAVSDLINSKTESAHSSSIKQLEGSLSEFVKKTRQDIINIVSLVELELDFAEEGLEFVKKEEIRSKITELNLKLENIISTYLTGKVIREGINLVIAGRPNSGKSSLFNYLLKTNRAIVSDIAGTTRDYIEENIIINGLLFNLIDTAGLRSSSDQIEREGINRSHIKINEADMILYLIDSSENDVNKKKDLEYFRNSFDKRKSILVYSKCDIDKGFTDGDYLNEGLNISLLKDETIEELKKEMVNRSAFSETAVSSSEILLTNLRHKICLENVVSSLKEAVNTIDAKMSGEYISVDLRNSLNYLGEITGEVTNDIILENIFRNFCIGK